MMFTMPVYDMMLLPGVTFCFKKDIFQQLGNQDAKAGDDVLFLMQRTDKDRKDLTPEDFYPVGVSGKLDSVDNEGNIRIRTVARVDLSDLEMAEDGILANASIRPDTEDITPEEEKAIFDRVKNVLLNYISQFQWGVLARNYVLHWKNLEETLCAVSGYIHIPWEDKYRIIETDSRKERCELIEKAIREAIEVNRVGVEAENAQKENNERLYREAALKKQIELLQQELDDMHPENISDVRRFEQKIEASGMGEEARKEADKVLNRMKQEGQDGHEYGMLYDYLEFVTSLSWKPEPAAAIDLKEAEKILDEDHYGLSKVKERIIQQLAVMALNKKQSGSVLLFVGAPGTGKTSIGQSIARALGRKYVRISLGGVRDEAEIRGHRRTYIGAMPGRIMQGMQRAGVMNPVMVLDEVDKLSKDYSGDPASPSGGAGPGAEQYLCRPLYECALRSLQCALCLHGQLCGHDPGAAPESYGSDPVPGLHGCGKIPDRETPSSSRRHEKRRNQSPESQSHGRSHQTPDQRLYGGSRCPWPEKTAGRSLPERGSEAGQRRTEEHFCERKTAAPVSWSS